MYFSNFFELWNVLIGEWFLVGKWMAVTFRPPLMTEFAFSLLFRFKRVWFIERWNICSTTFVIINCFNHRIRARSKITKRVRGWRSTTKPYKYHYKWGYAIFEHALPTFFRARGLMRFTRVRIFCKYSNKNLISRQLTL